MPAPGLVLDEDWMFCVRPCDECRMYYSTLTVSL